MNILFFAHELSASGPVVKLLEFCKFVRSMGHVPTVACPGKRTVHTAAFELAGIRIEPKLDIRGQDAAVVLTIMNHQIATTLSRQIPTICFITEGRVFLHNSNVSVSTLTTFFQAVQAFTFVHEFQRAVVYRSFLFDVPEGRVHVIPNGALPVPAALNAARPSGPIAICRKPTINFIGSLTRRKRPEDLLRAFRTSGLKDKGIHCRFIGDDRTDDKQSRAIKDAACCGEIELTGTVERSTIFDICRPGDIFCLPSMDEAFNLAALDAGLMGMAPILSDIPANEGIWEHGKNCLMHPVGDIRVLAAMLCSVIGSDQLRAALAANAIVTARKRSFETYAMKTLEVVLAVGNQGK
jgi:glycosyltransferase involved in cell wall biosynthesis